MAGDGLPIKQIVRVTGLNRNLVRQILRGEREDAFRLPASREPQADQCSCSESGNTIRIKANRL